MCMRHGSARLLELSPHPCAQDIAPLGKIPVSSAQMRAASSYEFTITATKNGTLTLPS